MARSETAAPGLQLTPPGPPMPPTATRPSSRAHGRSAAAAATLAALTISLTIGAGAGSAHAQTGNEASQFSKADFTIAFKDKNNDYITGTQLDTFFNRVNCACEAPVTIEVRLNAASRAKFDSTRMYESVLRAGDDTCVCKGAACGTINCLDVSERVNAAVLLNGPLDFKTNVRKLFEAGLASGSDLSTACDRDQAQSLWFWMDSSADSDMSTDVTDVTVQIQLDGRGPAAPTGVTVTPGNQALAVSWASAGLQSDLQGYQVMCSRGENLPPFKGVYAPAFTTKSEACSNTTVTVGALATPPSTPANLAINSAGVAVRGAPPPALAALNPDFLCSDLLPNQTSARLFRLQNDINYVVGVIAIDKRGNPSVLTEVLMETPKATQDFYTGYRSAGGQAEGGCAVAGTGSRSAGGLLLLFGALAVAFRRRRNTRREDVQ
ncbi:MAG TPA: MYXO-CTERM sorting domain-containing protein [Polyangia bacterium]